MHGDLKRVSYTERKSTIMSRQLFSSAMSYKSGTLTSLRSKVKKYLHSTLFRYRNRDFHATVFQTQGNLACTESSCIIAVGARLPQPDLMRCKAIHGKGRSRTCLMPCSNCDKPMLIKLYS